ncbi:RpnC/YadD family protein [Sphingobacterium lumbrici]|uniref:hypothetical protein n=1 Tax=Sphingobacterium lumbrici TaxID=2559600 RepID=UPI00112BBA11|nr:hypothetical protein [Sphingobacterium lumbrici]
MVKVYLRDGSEKWILVNVEIEGGSSRDFPFRFFQYHYRILDRYEVPVESIAVFTGSHRQRRSSMYRHEGIRTSIEFRYLSYHIFDNSEEELLKTDNIFGYIVLACQKALLEGKVAEEELSEHRSTIARALLGSKKYDKDRIISFLGFLKNFIFIEDKQINRIFDSYIYQVTGGTIDMGVIEILKKQERQAGLLQGLEQGLEQGIEKGIVAKNSEIVKKLIIQHDWSDEAIVDFAEVSLEFVKKVRKDLAKSKK